jgi:hypothetical protein
MQSFYTYLHAKPDGGIFYVGKGRGKRSREFVNARSLHHQNIVAECGAENIGVFEFPCCSEAEAFADERHQIAQLRAEGYQLVNVTSGGQGQSGRSPWNKGLPWPLEFRARISASLTGKKHSPETIAKRIASNIGRKRSPEACARIAAAKKGHSFGSCVKEVKRSAETRRRMAVAKLGNRNWQREDGAPWNKGVPCAPETRAKISATKKGVNP